MKKFTKDIQIKGFALVATISVMSLVILVALAMISLATVVTRTSGHGYHMEQARANARLALQEAVGKLQQYLGPDQRISAETGILSSINPAYAASSVHQRVLGAWNSIGGASVDPFDATAMTNFNANNRNLGMRSHIGWLVAGDNVSNVSATSSASNVALVGGGSVYDATDHIYVKKIGIGDEGAYSWFVMQEATKLGILPVDGGSDHNIFGSNGTSGLHRIDGFTNYNSNGKADKSITLQSVELANSNPQFLPDSSDTSLSAKEVLKKNYFDISPYNYTLQTNVQYGGPKVDLSLASERNSAGRFTGEVAPDVGEWADVWEYMRAYKAPNSADLDNSGLVRWSGASANGIPDGVPYLTFVDSTGAAALKHIYGRIGPVMSHWTAFVSHGVDLYGTVRVPYPAFTFDYEFWNSYSLPVNLNGHQSETWLIGMPFSIGWRTRQIDPAIPGHDPPFTPWVHSVIDGKPDGVAMPKMMIKNRTSTNQHQDIFWERPFRPGEPRKYSNVTMVHGGSSGGTDRQDVREGWRVTAGTAAAAMGNIVLDGFNLMVSGEFMGLDGDNWEVEPFIKPMFDAPRYAGHGGGQNYARIWAHNSTEGVNYEGAPTAWMNVLENIEDSRFEADSLIGPLRTGPRKPFAFIGMRFRAERHADGSGALEALNADPATTSTTVSERLYGKSYLYSNFRTDRGAVGCIGVNPTPSSDELNRFAMELGSHRYEFFAKNYNDYDDGMVDITFEGNNGFMGTSHNSEATTNGYEGVTQMVTDEIPYEPLLSLAQLQHGWFDTRNYAGSRYLVVGKLAGNSFPSIYVPSNQVKHTFGGRNYADGCYMVNTNLWDSCFLSGIADFTNPLVKTAWRRSHDQIIDDMFADTTSLPARNMMFLPNQYVGDLNTFKTLIKNKSDNTAYRQIGAYMANRNSFNVNSISVKAWIAFLCSVDNVALARLQSAYAATGNQVSFSTSTAKISIPVSRFTMPNKEFIDTASFSSDQTKFLESRWNGVRSLTYDEIEILAHAIVEEIKLRGPFLSVADFVNRRIGTGALSAKGVLQAAIDRPTVVIDGATENNSLNDSFKTTSRQTTLRHGVEVDFGDFTRDGTQEKITLALPNPTAAEGYIGEGAPGYITQADLLMSLAPRLTVRSDTYTVRAYGESKEGNTVMATAYCEAVVQRFPEYVDSTVAAHADIATVNANTTNKTYGRRFKVVLFKWLNAEEV